MNLFINAALLGFIPKSVKKGLMALAPVRRIRNAVMKDLGLPEDILTFVNYPTRFDSRETQAALKGSGIVVPQPEGLRLAAVGLLGASPRPRPAHRPHRCAGTVGGKVVLVTGGSSGHRPGGGAQVCRGRRHHASSAAATRTSWTRPARRPRHRGYQFIAYAVDIADMADCDRFIAAAGPEPRRRRFPDQQRRPLDPPRHRVQLRPLPRLRAHHAAQLLRLPARDHGLAARHGGQAQGPCGQHQLDRRADQCAALLGLRRLQGRAGRLDALRVERVRRPGHQLHDHQHAAGAHADDRADQDLQQRARRWRPKRRPT